MDGEVERFGFELDWNGQRIVGRILSRSPNGVERQDQRE
jgi:hypothetical protein